MMSSVSWRTGVRLWSVSIRARLMPRWSRRPPGDSTALASVLRSGDPTPGVWPTGQASRAWSAVDELFACVFVALDARRLLARECEEVVLRCAEPAHVDRQRRP